MAPKQTAKKTSNTRKKRTNSQNQKRVKESGAIQDEIILVIALAISILLFLSNFNLIGIVGQYFSNFAFGLVGLLSYVLPLIIFFITAFHISNYGNRRAGRKIISALIFFIALAAFIQLLTYGFEQDKKIFEYYTQSQNNHNGGGIIGGLFVLLFCSLFADVGTYIILIAVMLITITIITGKAIITYLAKKGRASLEDRKEYQRLRKEQAEVFEDAPRPKDNTRRPPKTYILDSDMNLEGDKLKSSKEKSSFLDDIKEMGNNLKGKKEKKEVAKEAELPVLNFDHLFVNNAETSEEQQKLSAMETKSGVPTYEEELQKKFGQAIQQEQEIQTEQVEAAIMLEPVKIEHPQETDTPVEPKKQNQEKSSTDVDNLNISQVAEAKEYVFPPVHLLNAPKGKGNKGGMTDKDLKDTAMKLQSTLESFGVHVTITNASVGPAVTRYELQPEQGVKVSRITSLADDIKLNLAANDVRIEAPIPGKAAVGIEVPNKENSMVTFRELIESKEFSQHSSGVAFAVGKDIGGQTVITDIAKMPHLLIAGATGSGKSVCINTLIMSILYKSKPSDVRLIMVDPKVVELNIYNGIPHLLIPVVTDPKKASAALNWAVMEMTERYKKFADVGARDLKGYNEKVSQVAHLNDQNCQKLPQIVIIIDELADLMMVAPGEVEDAICRLAQLARAAGIHLIIATQRPSVNVITGLIKANIPSRIAFAVSSAIDSRTIIDGSGAEKLLGKGDMLFFPSGYPKPVRIQGAFVSDKEVGSVVEFLKKNNNEANYSDDIHDKINNAKLGEGSSLGSADERDEYFAEAGKFIIDKDKASIGMLQRVYKIGFNRAARIMDQLSDAGVVGPEEGTKPRKVLMSLEEFEQYLEEY